MGKEMEEHYRPFKPCMYPSICADCDGLPEGVTVHFFSGKRLEVHGIAGIELTAEEIVLHPREGDLLGFFRREVFYAGCSRVPPPLD